MTKKSKPSLKDVSSFLKKQPHTLTEVKRPEEGLSGTKKTSSLKDTEVSDQVLKLVNSLNTDKGDLLIKVIIEALENEPDPTAEEIMLLNTAYFLNYSRSK
ncbi:MAG: hypothetical protein AAF363_01755 [Bacteroidota bacterium]